MQAHAHACTCASMHTCTHARTRACTHINIHACTHLDTRLYPCLHTFPHTCLYSCMCTSLYTCVCSHVYSLVHLYGHMSGSRRLVAKDVKTPHACFIKGQGTSDVVVTSWCQRFKPTYSGTVVVPVMRAQASESCLANKCACKLFVQTCHVLCRNISPLCVLACTCSHLHMHAACICARAHACMGVHVYCAVCLLHNSLQPWLCPCKA